MAEALEIQGGATDHPSILVVDDTPSILQLLRVLLCDDYDIVTVNSGLLAVEAFASKAFDLVLLDLLMPEIDGFETLKRLKQLPNFASTPVIFLTAMDDIESERCALELGADEYIAKPFKPMLVRLRINNLLQRVHLQRQLELALSCADKGLWEWDLRSGRVSIDTRWGERLYPVCNDMGDDLIRWENYCHPSWVSIIEEAKGSYLAGCLPAFDVDVQLLNADGLRVWINLYGKAVTTSVDGNFVRLTGTYRNIERRKQAEIALQKSEERFRFVMEATGEGIWDWRVASDVIAHNASFSRILGLNDRDLEHATTLIRSLIHPDDLASVAGSMAACLDDGKDFVSEHRVRHADGRYVWVAGKGRVVEWGGGGQPLRTVGSLRDISERKVIEAEYKRLALYDPLTGLPNRRLLVDRLRQAIIQNRRNKKWGVLMFLDMDRFKLINDTFGHESGDMLLIEVGRRLSSCIRETDTVARLGGDEFVIMLTQLPGGRAVAQCDAEQVGNKILGVLNQPYQLGPISCKSTPSIGLTLFGGDATESVDAIIKRADSAMYEAKMAGRNCLHLTT